MKMSEDMDDLVIRIFGARKGELQCFLALVLVTILVSLCPTSPFLHMQREQIALIPKLGRARMLSFWISHPLLDFLAHSKDAFFLLFTTA